MLAIRQKSKTTFSLINYTKSELVASFNTPDGTATYPLATGVVTMVREFDRQEGSIFKLSMSLDSQDSQASHVISLKRRINRKRKWAALKTDSSWRIYQLKLSRRHIRIFIFPMRPLPSWMKDLPDSVLLSNLCLPGTHETMALYGWPFSQCQDLTLSDQLRHGIRMVDIRIVLVDGELRAYHGLQPERATFTSILEEVCSYLESEDGKSETVIMSIMEEASFMPSSPLFSTLVRDAIINPPSKKSMWFLENRVPTLGEVRSKIILFSRFGGTGEGWEGGTNGVGIHPTRWPNNQREGFEWDLEKTRVRTQDWYGIPSFLNIPEKFAVAVEMLLPCPAPNGKDDLSITFMSAARVPFALPSTVACGFGWSALNLGVEGVNSRVGRWLLEQLGGDDDQDIASDGLQQTIKPLENKPGCSQVTLVKSMSNLEKLAIVDDDSRKEPRLRGWVLMDFLLNPYELGVVPLLIECNWRGRVDGEEGWRS